MKKPSAARRSRTTVKHGKKPPKSGVKSPAKTETQKMLAKWPPKV